jgi:hypothetical protein
MDLISKHDEDGSWRTDLSALDLVMGRDNILVAGVCNNLADVMTKKWDYIIALSGTPSALARRAYIRDLAVRKTVYNEEFYHTLADEWYDWMELHIREIDLVISWDNSTWDWIERIEQFIKDHDGPMSKENMNSIARTPLY